MSDVAANDVFTPEVINPDLCFARTWANGQGGQCTKKPKEGQRLCSVHVKNTSHGTVDGPIPEGKLREFRRHAASIKSGPRRSMDEPASGKHFKQLDAAFIEHFRQEGFAVLTGILGAKGTKQLITSFWDAMTAINNSIEPRNRSTWKFPAGYKGIQCSYGMAQSEFAWMVRQAPRVREAFSILFDTPCDQLCVSLDAVILSDSCQKKPPEPWLHKDQATEEATLSIQAIYTPLEVGPHDAGTVLIPRTHTIRYAWEMETKDGDGKTRQHLVVPDDMQKAMFEKAVKPLAPADSLILFNSKLVHANSPATRPRESKAANPLPNRLAVAVAFAPRDRRSEQTRKRKCAAYLEGRTSNHWPCDRFSLKRPRLFNFVKGCKELPKPPNDPARLALL